MSEEPTQIPDRDGEGRPMAGGVSFPEGTLAPEISLRVTAILDAVEREAEQLRADAHQEARRYLSEACRHADSLIDQRRRRIAEISDEILAKAEEVVAKLDDAAPVREGFESLVRSLGEAAERLSSEADLSRSEFDPSALHQGFASPEPASHQPFADQASFDVGAIPPGPYGAATEASAPGQAFEPQPEAGAPAWSASPPPPPRPPAAGEPPAADAARAQAQSPEAGWRGLDDMRLVAMRMAATGQTRDQVGDHLLSSIGVADPEPILDEVFGAGSAGGARVPWAAFPR
jgi:vacuolar-type H+-ATPase subunit H